MARRGGNKRSRGTRRRRFRPATAARTLTAVALGLFVTSIAAVAWLLLVYPKRPASGEGRRVVVQIPQGSTVGEVASALATAGAVDRGWLFGAYARILGAGSKLREGQVVLTDDLIPREVLRRVARGYGDPHVRVPVPEGYTRFDIARRLESWGVCEGDAFVAATEEPDLVARHGLEGPTLEGYLFPATYLLPQSAGPEQVIDQMVEAWRRKVEPLVSTHAEGLAKLEQDLGWGLHQVLTLASIVEKEATVREEQPIIAGVFLNRLRLPTFRPRRLQADPTVAYGCLVAGETVTSCVGFDGRRITRSMLQGSDNDYNTYRIEGLPPGPIANPGARAIEAVLAPEAHDYLYFVARGGGRHAFSRTLEEHGRAVEEYRNKLAGR